MLKIIPLNANNISVELIFGSNYTIKTKLNHIPKATTINDVPILSEQNFARTLAGINGSLCLDLEKRSSWTFNKQLQISTPSEAKQFFDQTNILQVNEYDNYDLLKYEVGDFFLSHKDTNLTKQVDALDDPDETKSHQYTCLIFCPFDTTFNTTFDTTNKAPNKLVGGELIFKHPESLYEIKFDPSVETNKNNYIMVIFSIDMYHEVLPIIEGSRYVLKKPLFVGSNNQSINKSSADNLKIEPIADVGFKSTIYKPKETNEVDALDDGVGNWLNNYGGGDY
jgi:hypothetical protein